MKKIIYTIISVFLSLGIGIEVVAQSMMIRKHGIGSKIVEPPDHLKPFEEKDFPNSFYKLEYYYSIRDILFKDLTAKPELRYICWFQMGQPFEVLDIEYSKSETKYYLIMHTFSHHKPIPDINKNTEKIGLRIYKKEISKKSVDLIKELFETAIKGAKFDQNEIAGLDGMSHYFFINENDVLKGGEIWSPNKRSRMRRLVNIGEQLIELAKSNAEVVKFDTKFTCRIIDLNNELKSSRQPIQQ